MEAFAENVFGEVAYSRIEGGYYIELHDREGKRLGKTGFYTSEAKARDAARKLAKSYY
jgi:hypothetical protein